MSWKSLSHSDGTWGLDHPDGFRPIRVSGKPLSEFPLGWRPRGLFDGPGEFCLVDLSHDSGESTFWILDRDLSFLFELVNSRKCADYRCIPNVCIGDFVFCAPRDFIRRGPKE